MTFGKRLSKLRIKHNLDQQQLADILNLSKSTISMYESDQRTPNPETIIIIAEQFNVTTDYLLRGSDRTDLIYKDDKGEFHYLEAKSDLDEKVKQFIERYNKLDEDEQEFLMKKIDKLTKTLEDM